MAEIKRSIFKLFIYFDLFERQKRWDTEIHCPMPEATIWTRLKPRIQNSVFVTGPQVLEYSLLPPRIHQQEARLEMEVSPFLKSV